MTDTETQSKDKLSAAERFVASCPTIPTQSLSMPYWLRGARQLENVILRAAARAEHVLRSTGMNCLIHILDLDRRRPPTSKPNWRAVETTFGDLDGVHLSTVRGLGKIYHPLAGAVVQASAPDLLDVEFPDNSLVQYTLTSDGWSDGRAFPIDDRYFPCLHVNWVRSLREGCWMDLYDEDNHFGIIG